MGNKVTSSLHNAHHEYMSTWDRSFMASENIQRLKAKRKLNCIRDYIRCLACLYLLLVDCCVINYFNEMNEMAISRSQSGVLFRLTWPASQLSNQQETENQMCRRFYQLLRPLSQSLKCITMSAPEIELIYYQGGYDAKPNSFLLSIQWNSQTIAVPSESIEGVSKVGENVEAQ